MKKKYRTIGITIETKAKIHKVQGDFIKEGESSISLDKVIDRVFTQHLELKSKGII
ncbi:MAG: hypothetical protein QT11_C0001G0209 [archaeon GW2011_AR20]|nr:MAG: hypothetical protein QT11_C0001G0209 [archaeon GW2011_AR20]MBS3160628.1 hypothetical protein [Candidatus Woesearchaeota archaeon]